jgi:hypothetical protein
VFRWIAHGCKALSSEPTRRACNVGQKRCIDPRNGCASMACRITLRSMRVFMCTFAHVCACRLAAGMLCCSSAHVARSNLESNHVVRLATAGVEYSSDCWWLSL